MKSRSLRLVIFALVIVVTLVVGLGLIISLPSLAAEALAQANPPTDNFEKVVVDSAWLAENLDNPKVRVIEVSVVPGLYERGHIPGAVNFIWHTDFVDTVRRDIVSPERFQELLRAAGIDSDTTVILYGDNNNWFAAWGAWIFTIYGVEDIRLLNGGRAKWEAEGRELAVKTPNYTAGKITIGEPRADLRLFLPDVLEVVEAKLAAETQAEVTATATVTATVTAEEAAEIAATEAAAEIARNTVIIDIRSPAEFEGTVFAPEGFQELAIRAGHIPTAVNVPWGRAVNEDGTFKSVEELRELYAAVGVDGSQPIIVYCRIGERASHTWFVLSQILGYDVALYDGSWTEWGNTVGVPIQNPAGTVWGAQ